MRIYTHQSSMSRCIYIYICVCVYIYICIHTHICICIYIYMYIHQIWTNPNFFFLICSWHEDLFGLMIGLTSFAQISRDLQGLPSTKNYAKTGSHIHQPKTRKKKSGLMWETILGWCCKLQPRMFCFNRLRLMWGPVVLWLLIGLASVDHISWKDVDHISWKGLTSAANEQNKFWVDAGRYSRVLWETWAQNYRTIHQLNCGWCEALFWLTVLMYGPVILSWWADNSELRRWAEN